MIRGISAVRVTRQTLVEVVYEPGVDPAAIWETPGIEAAVLEEAGLRGLRLGAGELARRSDGLLVEILEVL